MCERVKCWLLMVIKVCDEKRIRSDDVDNLISPLDAAQLLLEEVRLVYNW